MNSGLCHKPCASAQLTPVMRSINLCLKIGCKGRQLNASATAKKGSISSVRAALSLKEAQSTYVHFHGNALHLHSALKITGLRNLLETAYEVAIFKTSREDAGFQGM